MHFSPLKKYFSFALLFEQTFVPLHHALFHLFVSNFNSLFILAIRNPQPEVMVEESYYLKLSASS